MLIFDENDKKSIREKTVEFVKDAVTKLDGVVELKPDASKFPYDAKQFNYRFVNQKISGSFTLSGEEQKDINSNIFDYLYTPEKSIADPDLLLPKSRFVTTLLSEVFDRFSILSHRVGELTTPLKPAPIFAPHGTFYSLVADGSAQGKSSTMTVIEAHMSVECKLQGATESFIDIMVCDERGCPVSAEQQIKYLRRRKAMLRDFDSAQGEDISDEDKAFFEQNLNSILENVMNGWKDTLSYQRDNKLGQYFKKVEAQFNYELAAVGGHINPEPFRPTVELRLLSLYYLQTPCVEFDYEVKDSATQQPKARFSLRVNRNDNKTVFRCGVCEEDCEVNAGGEQLYICAESGEVFSDSCKPIKAVSIADSGENLFIHAGNEHKKWLAQHPFLAAPPKNCTLCAHHDKCFDANDDTEHYVCSDFFHQCGEQGCKSPVCENLAKYGLAAFDKTSGVYFCKDHMASVCSECGTSKSSERISQCSCGRAYCLDCASDKAAVCSACGKTICQACGIHLETDDIGNKTGTVLCSQCVTQCTCGATVSKDKKVCCAICQTTQRCAHCKGHDDFFDINRLPENKKRDISQALSLADDARICPDCIKLCSGNCDICPNYASYCQKGMSQQTANDRTFPNHPSLWAVCQCCDEEYPLIYLFDGKCATCHDAENKLLDTSSENIALMKGEYVKHKNKINVAIQFQLGGLVNAISENQTRLVIANKKKIFVLDKKSGKGKLFDR